MRATTVQINDPQMCKKRVSIQLVGKCYMVVASQNLLTELLLLYTPPTILSVNLTMENQFKCSGGRGEMTMVQVNGRVRLGRLGWDR